MVAFDHQRHQCLTLLLCLSILSTLCNGYAWTASNPEDSIFSILPRNIFKRGICESVNSNTVTNLCTPSSTVCCVQPGKAFPQCLEYNGAGWCCDNRGTSKQCYVDLPSDCAAPGAVNCPHLAAGVKEACCPQDTTCAPGNQTAKVRCNIPLSLVQSKTTSSSTAKATSTTSTSSTSPATKTTASPAATTAGPTRPSKSVSYGAIIGIVIGALAVIAGVAYFFLKRHRRNRLTRESSPSAVPLQQPDYNGSEADLTTKTGNSALFSEAGGDEVHEMSGIAGANTRDPVTSELDGGPTGAKSPGAERGEVHELGG